MNMPSGDVLSVYEKAAILACIREGIDDAQMKVAITYSLLTSTSLDFDTGALTRTETDLSLNALRRIMTEKEVSIAPEFLQVGDREYLLDFADFSGSIPSKNDQITDGTDVLGIIMWQADPLDLVYRVVARQI